MDASALIAALAAEGPRLVEAAERAGPDAAVPTCPDWRVRDLLGHIGQVHRWAAGIVAQQREQPPSDGLAPVPGDDRLLGWVSAGHAELVRTLAAAADDLACWAFLPAPSPRAFWARRQAHETAIHRVDAEAATGRETSPVDAAFAADGIDELLLGFFGRRRSRLVSDPPVRLGVRASDTGDEWSIEVGPERRTAEKGAAAGDCVVTGAVADLYLLLWNRLDRASVRIDGAPEVLDLWRDRALVTWS